MTLPIIDNQQSLVETQVCCSGLTSAFAQLVDTGRYEELVELFTEDCEFDRPGAQLRGRAQLLGFMQGRPTDTASRHVCAGTVIESVTETTARGTTLLCYYHGEPGSEGPGKLMGLTAIAEYRDDFVRTASGWRIARRRVVPMLSTS